MNLSSNLFNAWDTYYSDDAAEPNKFYQNFIFKSQKLVATKSNCYFYHCSFIKSNQGSIKISSATESESSNLFVELCSFIEITNNQIGGSISVSPYGQCIFSSICGAKCHSSTDGQFCYIVTSKENSKNHIFDSSFALTVQNGYYTLYHRNGNISCNRINVSNNNVYRVSGIAISYPHNSSISFSIFSKNNSTTTNGNICIVCGSDTHQITSTNVIENMQDSVDRGIIYVEGYAQLTMKDCNVYKNCLIGNGHVFHVSSGSITCVNCSMTEDQMNNTSENVTMLQIPSELFFNSYSFYDLKNCIIYITPKPWYPRYDSFRFLFPVSLSYSLIFSS